MTTIIQEAQIAHTADLLTSLKTSLWKLRQDAERLSERVEAGDFAEIGCGSKELSQVRSLVTLCQKTEAQLAELEGQRDGSVQGGVALDLDAARAEIGRRLARLRAVEGAGRVSD